MKKVLFLGGPYHEQVREVEDPYRPVRFPVPKREVRVTPSDEYSYFYDDGAMFNVEEYLVKELIVFGIKVPLQVTPDWYMMADSWLSEKCLKAIGFR